MAVEPVGMRSVAAAMPLCMVAEPIDTGAPKFMVLNMLTSAGGGRL